MLSSDHVRALLRADCDLNFTLFRILHWAQTLFFSHTQSESKCLNLHTLYRRRLWHTIMKSGLLSALQRHVTASRKQRLSESRLSAQTHKVFPTLKAYSTCDFYFFFICSHTFKYSVVGHKISVLVKSHPQVTWSRQTRHILLSAVRIVSR